MKTNTGVKISQEDFMKEILPRLLMNEDFIQLVLHLMDGGVLTVSGYNADLSKIEPINIGIIKNSKN